MATRAEALDWLNATVGQHLDYDGVRGQQCVDYFNFYYRQITGRNPYADGLHSPKVDGAKDLWTARIGDFTYVPDSNDLVPQSGDIAIYGAAWGNGNGHVEVVLSTDNDGCNFVGENQHGNQNEGVVRVYRSFVQMRGLLGVMRYNWPSDAPVYNITPMEPKRMRVAANHYKWNLAQSNFDTIVANPITTSNDGFFFDAVATITRPDLPNYTWYGDDVNTPHGWNSLDCSEYVAPAPLPAPAAPYVPPAAPITAQPAKKYKVLTTVMYFGNGQDAQFKNNGVSTIAPGSYYLFDKGSTTVQLGDDNMTPKYWINTKDNVEQIPVKVAPPVEPPDAWKATRVSFYDDRNRFDNYELQMDVLVRDLDNKGKDFFVSAYKPNSSDNAVLKVYGTVYKDGVKYYFLHHPEDVNWVNWYVIPQLNKHTGKPYLLKYSETYDTTPKAHELTMSELALEGFARLGYKVIDVVKRLRIR